MFECVKKDPPPAPPKSIERIVHSCPVDLHSKSAHPPRTQGFCFFHEREVFEKSLFDAVVSAEFPVMFRVKKQVLSVPEVDLGSGIINLPDGEPEPHIAHRTGLNKIFPKAMGETARQERQEVELHFFRKR